MRSAESEKPLPFTSAPSRVVRDDPRAVQIERAATDDSYDARQHTAAAIKRPCPICDAAINERCADERYPSGRAKTFAYDFHAERGALVTDPQPESETTVTTATPTTKPTSQPKPASRQRKSGDPRTDRAATAKQNAKITPAKSQPKPAPEPTPEPAAKPKPEPKLPADKLIASEKRALTRPIARVLADLIDSLPDDDRRPLVAQWVTDSICRYLPKYADAEQRDPRLPEPTPFAAAKSSA